MWKCEAFLTFNQIFATWMPKLRALSPTPPTPPMNTPPPSPASGVEILASAASTLKRAIEEDTNVIASLPAPDRPKRPRILITTLLNRANARAFPCGNCCSILQARNLLIYEPNFEYQVNCPLCGHFTTIPDYFIFRWLNERYVKIPTPRVAKSLWWPSPVWLLNNPRTPSQ